MTHVDIDYSAHKTESDKRKAAIADIINYLGKEKFNYLTNEFSKFGVDAMPLDAMSGYLMLAGISGYPVQAWHEFIFQPDENGLNAYERMQLA